MALVFENMEEFIRDHNPRTYLNIGKVAQIEEWMDLLNVKLDVYSINKNFKIDFDSGLYLSHNSWVSSPDYICFERIAGNFDISYNKGTKNLDRCPDEVDGSFICHHCDLETLEGGPDWIGGDFNASFNNLKDLKGFPKEIMGWVSIGENDKQFTEEEIRAVCNVHGKVYTTVADAF